MPQDHGKGAYHTQRVTRAHQATTQDQNGEGRCATDTKHAQQKRARSKDYRAAKVVSDKESDRDIENDARKPGCRRDDTERYIAKPFRTPISGSNTGKAPMENVLTKLTMQRRTMGRSVTADELLIR